MNERDKRYQAQYRYAEHYLGVLRKAKELYARGSEAVLESLTIYDEERMNIKQGQRWSAEQAKTNVVGCLFCIEYCDAAIGILNLREHPQVRIEWLDTGVKSAQAMNIREAEGVALGNLGMAHKDLGQVSQALELYQRDSDYRP